MIYFKPCFQSSHVLPPTVISGRKFTATPPQIVRAPTPMVAKKIGLELRTCPFVLTVLRKFELISNIKYKYNSQTDVKRHFHSYYICHCVCWNAMFYCFVCDFSFQNYEALK